MPIAQFSGGHGTASTCTRRTPTTGPPGLRVLIEECHRLGLAVIVDVVHNHFGPEGDYTSEYGPYKTDRYRTTWGNAINLDGDGSREVRRFLIDSALSWLRDYGVDGLRLDAIVRGALPGSAFLAVRADP